MPNNPIVLTPYFPSEVDFLTTEDGDILTTEDGDFLITQLPNPDGPRGGA